EDHQLLDAGACAQQEDHRAEQRRRLDGMDQRQPSGGAPGRARHRGEQRHRAPAGRPPGLRLPPPARSRLSRHRGVQGASRKVDRWASAYTSDPRSTVDWRLVSDERPKFETQSGIPLAPSYGPSDLGPDWTYESRLGDAGQYPFTRGPHASM